MIREQVYKFTNFSVSKLSNHHSSAKKTALLHLPPVPPHLLRHFADSVGCVVLPIRGVQNESFWPDAVPR